MGASIKLLREKQKQSRKKSPAITAKKYYSPDEMKIILDSIKSIEEKRPDVYFFLMLCVFTGARRNEILLMRKDQIHKNGMVTIEGSKKSQDRSIYLDKLFHKKLLDFLETIDEYLFDFHPDTATRFMKKHTPPSVKVQRPLHALRHHLGLALYSRTKDLRFVQKYLGHVDPKSTSVYVAAVDIQEYSVDDLWSDLLAA